MDGACQSSGWVAVRGQQAVASAHWRRLTGAAAPFLHDFLHSFHSPISVIFILLLTKPTIKLTNLRGSSSPRRSFSGMDRHRLWARAATVPAPICRACTCRRVMVSWMVLALASGRICCLREHCARVTAARSVAVEPSCLGQTALAATVCDDWAPARATGFACVVVSGRCAWLCAGRGDLCGTGVDAHSVLACLGSSCTYRHWF